jgi:signal transduction histidine kinase
VITKPVLVEALTTAEPRQRNLEVVGEDGRAYVANISPIFSRSRRLMGRVAVLHDVTEFKEADSLKSEFVANVSHDLKTPLTIISQSASELSMDGDLSQEQKSLTENILAAVDRIVNFVDTMLDIERLEAGKELIYETFDVGDLLEELAMDQWYSAHSSKLTIRTKFADDLPPLRADRAALYQALENLFSNAIKYAPNSGELLLAAELKGQQMVISLRDRGPGIAEQDQRHVFDKGFRVKRHGAGQVKGSGMGLAYVRTAAERHGGRAWCESTVGKGSTFFIALPLAPANG